MPRSKASQKRKADATAPTVVKKEKKDEPSSSKDKPIEKVVKFSSTFPIDEEFPQYVNGPYHVYKDGDEVYNVMLNQTNIGENNNKYYIMQLLKHDTKSEFVNLCRWGRVGKIAGKTDTVHTNLHAAKADFGKKFYSKTGNVWYVPYHFFIEKKGKYKLVEIDYGEEAAKQEVKEVKEGKSSDFIPSKLPEQVQDLLRLIFNTQEWEASVKEMKFDVKKAPLGKLTKKQITAGYESLKKVEDCLNPGVPEKQLVDACSEFYTRVPHDFGMKRPPLIKTKEEIKEKMDLLEALNDIQIGVSLINEEKGKEETNKLDYYYDSINCDIKPLEKNNPDYKTIEKYIKNTHGELHGHFKLKVEDIFEVNKEQCSKKFKKSVGNRMLLWHGSRLTNWCGILKEGLRIAPPAAPVTGYMFGKGVYFADMVSKSANYCFTSARQPIGFLLVCDVALGNMNEKTDADYNANKLPKGKHSTKGLGRQAPPKKQNQVLPDGVEVPLGKPKDTNVNGSWLRYNEYIVYDTAQINPRFLVKTRFNFNF